LNDTIEISNRVTEDAATEAVLAAIQSRRSIGRVTDEVPPRELIERVLEAGRWAPSHHLTEPWRFFVLEGAAREAFGAVMGQVAAAGIADAEEARLAFERAAAKPLRAPYVIAVAVEPAEAPNVFEVEEIAAVAAAAQNMLLATHALGLAAMWRTGAVAYEPAIREFFGLSPRATVLGFLYVGFAAMPAPARERRALGEVVTWLGDESVPQRRGGA
jgi:nitroreductase